MAEQKNLYVTVTINEKGEIDVKSSLNVEHAIKLLNEGITVCIDATIEEKYGKVKETETHEEIITTEE